MKRSFLWALLTASVCVGGCSTLAQSSLLGAGLGSLAGGSLGLLAPPGRYGQHRLRNVAISGLVGGLLGAGSGYLLHEVMAKASKQSLEPVKELEPKNIPAYIGGTNQPVLTPPKVETRFVDDQVRGNVFVPGHIEYNITEPARWNHE